MLLVQKVTMQYAQFSILIIWSPSNSSWSGTNWHDIHANDAPVLNGVHIEEVDGVFINVYPEELVCLGLKEWPLTKISLGSIEYLHGRTLVQA